ncbi:hypothetical protein UlMin_003128 [Ulmus minor]
MAKSGGCMGNFERDCLRVMGVAELDLVNFPSTLLFLSIYRLQKFSFIFKSKIPIGPFSIPISKHKIMAGKYKLIPDIALGQMNWTAKVIVAKKLVPKTTLHSPTKYQNMTVIDPQGNKVQTTIYEANILAFKNKLQFSKTYLISNAVVKHNKPQYRQIASDVQWTINGKTKVEELEENHSSLLFSTYEFVPFEKLQDHMDCEYEISIFAIAINMHQKRQVQTLFDTESPVQDIILIDQRFICRVSGNYTYNVGQFCRE